MNWEAVGAIGEVLGALAVVFTLIYLAAQIRGGQVALRASQRDSALESVRHWNQLIASNRELADIVRRGLKDYGGLDPTEKLRFGHCIYSFLKANEDIYLRNVAGEEANEVWASHEAAFLLYARQPGVRAWLRESERLFSPGLVATVRGGGDPADGGGVPTT